MTLTIDGREPFLIGGKPKFVVGDQLEFSITLYQHYRAVGTHIYEVTVDSVDGQKVSVST